jgi:hypothetical protein
MEVLLARDGFIGAFIGDLMINLVQSMMEVVLFRSHMSLDSKKLVG